MKFTLERVTQPDIEPVTLAEARRHLKMYDDITDEDDDIELLISGAREWAEDYTGRALIDQTWRLTLGENLSPLQNVDSDTVSGVYTGQIETREDGILLRKAPALAITGVVTVDSAGDETTIDVATYELREAASKWPRLVGLNGANLSGNLVITYRAGFADRLGSPQQGAEMVPARFKQAIKLHVEAMYDRDEKMMQILLDAAANLLKPERCELQLA